MKTELISALYTIAKPKTKLKELLKEESSFSLRQIAGEASLSLAKEGNRVAVNFLLQQWNESSIQLRAIVGYA